MKKKSIIVLLVLLIIISLVLLLNYMGIISLGFKNSSKYEKPVELTYEEYSKKIERKDSFILFIWQTDCSHCEEFEPVLNSVIKENNLEIYSINLKNLSEDEYDKIKNKTFVKGTPTIVYFKDGVTQTNKLVGSKTKSVLEKYLIKIGYIGEK